ncbi:MAG: DUF4337 domain-containing protein [Selenomonadaceae bacterium]|nr:DUF4337 domain-containing protein [Selenomonadaceae bacterium]
MADDKTKIDEDKQQDFPKRTNQLIALTALILAICATFSSLYAGANASKGILSQNKASDSWAYYQAKSMKETMYRIQLDALEIDPPANTNVAELKAKYKSEIERYDAEEEEIKATAIGHEADRDKFLALNRGFAGALTYLQIAILLTSLAGLMKQIGFWYAGIALGAFGVFNFLTTMSTM